MPKPFALAFGPWLPDGADVAFGVPYQTSQTPVPLSDCSNVYFNDSAYRTLQSFVSVNPFLGVQCLGAFTAIDASGTPQIFVGTATDLAQQTGSFTWNNRSKSSGAYSGAQHWSFTQFGNCVLASDGIHPLQDIAIGSGAFADVASAPLGNVIGYINQSFFVGDLVGSPNYPHRVQWSAIGDPTSWPTPLTDAAVAAQSSYEDLDQEFGAVQFITSGVGNVGVILQRHGITRATYVGADTVFQFVAFERKRGCIARTAAVQAGAVTHFIADDGFNATDGSQVIPTGTTQSAALDRWFWSNVNQSALSVIRGAYDAHKKNVIWAIPTGTNTRPDTLLFHHPDSGQWTKASVPTEFIWTDNDGTRHRLGVIDQSHNLGYLTGAGLTGYCETYDMAFVDGIVRSVTEAQPHILCTDTPLMRIGVKQAIDESPRYTRDIAREPFTKRATFDPPSSGLFVRARLTSSAANAMSGATLYTEQDGAV